jgi:hypothetical protein
VLFHFDEQLGRFELLALSPQKNMSVAMPFMLSMHMPG